MHCVAAQKIERNAMLLDQVRTQLERWRANYGKQAPKALDEWRELLHKPWPQIAGFVTSNSERATRLRQSSPFACVLTDDERERVYAAFRS